MAAETKPAWVQELKERLARPRTPEKQAQIDRAVERIRELNKGEAWPPGTFQHILDEADREDEEDEQYFLSHGS